MQATTRSKRVRLCVALTFAAVFSKPTHAQTVEPELHAATSIGREFQRDLSADRPDTTESPFTVEAGRFQLELSFLDATYDRRSRDEMTRRELSVAPLLFKLGVSQHMDLQIGIDPFVHLHTTDRRADDSTTRSGFGDTTVRLKFNLWGNDGGDTAMALMPFVTLPTASDGTGVAQTEGGIILPLAISLPGEFSLGLMAEADFVRSERDDRYVIDWVHTAAISRPLTTELGAFVEYAGFMNLNADTDYRAYLNTGLTLAITPDLQFDAGVRFGLTEVSDDIALFTGMTLRF